MGALPTRALKATPPTNILSISDKAKKHWSFQPIVKSAVPQPPDPQQLGVRRRLIHFILDKMLPKGPDTHHRRAEKVTLLRRVTFDLIGLPPSPKEVEDLVSDTSSNASETVVDRLLASPHYGERWGRHWLDAARYADTRGNNGGQRDEHYPYSYIYRDYVIRAFNEDLPYNQFLIQQIAADKLPLSEDKHALAAMGFLTLGNRFNNQANDIIDDRIDTIFKGTMALTVTCARCHDHKFDPIPTKDYYALHGGYFQRFLERNQKEERHYWRRPESHACLPGFLQGIRLRARRRTGKVPLRHWPPFTKAEMIGHSAAYMLALQDFKPPDERRFPLHAFFEKRTPQPCRIGFVLGQLFEKRREQPAISSRVHALGCLYRFERCRIRR